MIIKYYPILLWFFISSVFLITCNFLKSKCNREIFESIKIVIFINMSVLFYIILRENSSILNNKFILTWNFDIQNAVLVLASNLLFQLVVVVIINNLFYRMLIPSILNIFFLLFVQVFIGWGIINTVWFIIYTGALSGFIFLNSIFFSLNLLLEESVKIKNEDERKEILKFVYEESNKYIKLGLQTFLALSASIGVSMTILFKNGKESWDNPDNLYSSILIAFNFGLISLGIAFWLIKPYLNSFWKLKFYYKDTIRKYSSMIITKKP